MAPPAATPAPIRVLLVDDYLAVREGLRLLLERHDDITVVGEAATSRDAIALAKREQPSVALLELDLANDEAMDLIPALTAASLHIRVLVLTRVRDLEQHRRAIRAGASGVVSKRQNSNVLVKAIRRVHAGEVWADRETTATVLRELQQGAAPSPEAKRIATLTARERDIVKLVAQGHGTQKIAAMLFISDKTVRNHLGSIYDKLKVSERLELALYAAKHGLVTGPADSSAS